jgi:tRNA 2-selenouridine synthase
MPNPNAESILDAKSFWRASRDGVVFDVRSPGEFKQGHLPGAVNLPLFDDAERAEVGTIFKNSGRRDAVIRGLGLVGPKMASLAKTARQFATKESTSVFVHCWRGGMRSQSMHWLLSTIDLSPKILDGGYKAFRHLAHEEFKKSLPLQVISGLTGAGKTKVLLGLKKHGEAVIDLEGLANHRGSAFGAIGQNPQPTTEQFENNLFAELDRFHDPATIWVEDEGNRLGTVVVPPEFVRQLKSSPGIFLESSSRNRVEHLMHDYGDFAPDRLKESVNAIRKRLGFDIASQALKAIDSGQIATAIEIVLDYYDRTYLHAVSKSPRPSMPNLNIDDFSDDQVVEKLMEMV